MKGRYAQGRVILAKSLILLRKGLGLTQLEVAEHAGVSRQYIAKLEITEDMSVSRPYFESICRTLNTTEQWLTAGAGWAYNPTTVYEALHFANGCLNRLQPSAVTICHNDNGYKGLVFTGPFGAISISDSHTADMSLPATAFVWEEIMRTIKAAKISTNRIDLSEPDNARLSQTDLTALARAGGRK